MAGRVVDRLTRFYPRPRDDRDALRYLRGRAQIDRETAAAAVVSDCLAGAERVAGARFAVRAVMVYTLARLAAAPQAQAWSVELGRHHLAQQTGHSLRTVTTALMALRAHGLVHTPVRGRKGQGCSVLAIARPAIGALVAKLGGIGSARQLAGMRKALAAKGQRARVGTKDSPQSVSGVHGRPTPTPAQASVVLATLGEPPGPGDLPHRVSCSHGRHRHACIQCAREG